MSVLSPLRAAHAQWRSHGVVSDRNLAVLLRSLCDQVGFDPEAVTRVDDVKIRDYLRDEHDAADDVVVAHEDAGENTVSGRSRERAGEWLVQVGAELKIDVRNPRQGWRHGLRVRIHLGGAVVFGSILLGEAEPVVAAEAERRGLRVRNSG